MVPLQTITWRLYFATLLKKKLHSFECIHFSFGQFNDRHWLGCFWQQFCTRSFARLLLTFGHIIDVGWIYNVSKFQHQTRSRSETSDKKLMSNNVSAVPSKKNNCIRKAIHGNLAHCKVRADTIRLLNNFVNIISRKVSATICLVMMH